MGSQEPRQARPSRRERERSARRQAREADLAAQARARKTRLVVGLGAVAIVLVLAALVSARALMQPGEAGVAGSPVSPTVLQALTSIPSERFAAVGQGSATGLPVPVRAQVLRGASGLPRVVYIGAEYCPYCAAQRWALVVALSRFGSFSGLRTARSAAEDVYPSTPTFTFYGATYTSQYLEFSSVELQTSVRAGGGYQPLQTPTAEEELLLRQYNAPPYVPAKSAGGIPFLDFANQYVITGTSFDVGVIHGRSWEEIADSLSVSTSPRARAILGSANVLTAAICSVTGDNPASVCGEPAVRAIEEALANTPVPTGTR